MWFHPRISVPAHLLEIEKDMNAAAIIDARKHLEALKQFRETNARGRFTTIGYAMEFLGGIGLLGGRMFVPRIPSVLWSDMIFFAIGIFLLSHSLYLQFRSRYDKKVISILERILSDADAVK
jgi:hypothetical protein